MIRFPFLVSLSGSAAFSIILTQEEKYQEEKLLTPPCPHHTHLFTSCLGPGWVRVKSPPSQDDPFSGDCCGCPPSDPGSQRVGEWSPTEPYQTAAEEVKRG